MPTIRHMRHEDPQSQRSVTRDWLFRFSILSLFLPLFWCTASAGAPCPQRWTSVAVVLLMVLLAACRHGLATTTTVGAGLLSKFVYAYLDSGGTLPLPLSGGNNGRAECSQVTGPSESDAQSCSVWQVRTSVPELARLKQSVRKSPSKSTKRYPRESHFVAVSVLEADRRALLHSYTLGVGCSRETVHPRRPQSNRRCTSPRSARQHCPSR